VPAEVTISCKGVEIYGITKVSIFSEGKKIITVLLFLFVCYVVRMLRYLVYMVQQGQDTSA
jgi:hypothetical protein